jgi:uncharacterized protein
VKYIPFGKKGNLLSVLGFGCLRFPVIDGDSTKIDKVLALEMLNYAYDHGVNYFDTGYPYHAKDINSHGSCEPFIGEFISDKRDKVYIGAKIPCWLVNGKADLNRIFEAQLAALKTDYIDYYMFHSFNEEYYEQMKKIGAFEFIEDKLKKGIIKHIGFSFHDTYPVFEKIINAYDWDFCQLQYNFIDTHNQAGTKGLKLAYKKGVDVAIMEPLRGGKLLKLNDQSLDILKCFDKKRSIADWSYSWVYSMAEKSMVMSGMSTIEHVIENVDIASNISDHLLNEEEINGLKKINDIIDQSTHIPCTGCGYCLPCPSKVKIPVCFSCYNSYFLFNDEGSKRSAKSQYVVRVVKEAMASNCTGCKLCEQHCPQGIEISKEMIVVAATLE